VAGCCARRGACSSTVLLQQERVPGPPARLTLAGGVQIAAYLTTVEGARWLAEVLADWEDKLHGKLR